MASHKAPKASHQASKAMQQVPIREFKARLSHFLAQAGKHGAIEVTSHRKVVARIIGIPVASEGVARLIAKGAIAWQGGKPAGAAIRLAKRGKSVSMMLLEDRG